MAKAYSAKKIFTGDHWLEDHAVLVDQGKIAELLPVASLPANMERQHFPDHILAPAFIDLQIYGAHGKLLAVYPETDALFKLTEYCRSGGAALCLPTVATNHYDVFYRAIDAIKEYWEQGGKGVLGIHLEGPWINPVKRGAHIESCIHPPNLDQAKQLLEYGKGVIRMITLAPEVCDRAVIDLVLSHGIVISAGHSNATYEEAIEGFDQGITAVTHLYNAMSPLQHRAPGLVGAAMDHPRAMASIIPDGHHVDFAAIRIAKQVMKERLFVITDAVTTTDRGSYQHYLAGDKYEAGGILSGSALTMGKSVQNLVDHAGIDRGEAIRMCSLYPAKVLKLQDEWGRIAPGYSAEMVLLDDANEVLRMVSGE